MVKHGTYHVSAELLLLFILHFKLNTEHIYIIYINISDKKLYILYMNFNSIYAIYNITVKIIYK